MFKARPFVQSGNLRTMVNYFCRSKPFDHFNTVVTCAAALRQSLTRVRLSSAREVRRTLESLLATVLTALLLSGCVALDESSTGDAVRTESPALAQPQAPTMTPSAVPAVVPVPPAIAPFEQAVSLAADSLFSQARAQRLDSVERRPYNWLVDPLIDGVSGMQSRATRSMAKRIAEIAGSKHPDFVLQEFSGANLSRSPLVLIGTLTPVNGAGDGKRPWEAYSLCLALADPASGVIIAKTTAQAHMEDVDHTPTPYFLDSPGWIKDAATEIYIATCRSAEAGAAIPAPYHEGLRTSALISAAIARYDDGRPGEALDLFNQSRQAPAGNESRIYNGLYLANMKLGRHVAALDAFGNLVDYGLTRRQLAVKFHFKPGAASFEADRQPGGIHSMWLRQIARRAAKSNSCLEITGHSSASGPEPLNERLSQMRAEYIMKRLQADAPQLRGRTIASGAGSRENLVGTGSDDISDALDRRVVFHVHSCS